MSRATIRIPGPLRDLTDRLDDVTVDGATVAEALDALMLRYPGLRRHLRSERGPLREHVNIFLNADDIRSLDGELCHVEEGDVITIVPSIEGG
jgi:molybdopterin synthase sulfur carrier subunit